MPDGGQRILLATDRPASFAEAPNQGAVVGDFDVTVVELTLDAEGNGEGQALGGHPSIRAGEQVRKRTVLRSLADRAGKQIFEVALHYLMQFFLTTGRRSIYL